MLNLPMEQLEVFEHLKNGGMSTVGVGKHLFSFTFLFKCSWVLWRAIKETNMLQLNTDNFNILRWRSSLKFSQFWWSKCFFPSSTGSWFLFQNGRNIPDCESTLKKTSKSILAWYIESREAPPARSIPLPSAFDINVMSLVNKISNDYKAFWDIKANLWS